MVRETSIELRQIVDSSAIVKFMEAYGRTHGEFDFESMSVMWSTVERGAAVEYDSSLRGREGDAMA